MTKRKDSAEKAILPKWRIVKTTPILRLRASPTEQALPTISRRLEGTANDVVSTSDCWVPRIWISLCASND